MSARPQTRSCVRNFCTNATCQCVACTPRAFDPKRVEIVPPICICTLDYSQRTVDR